jgi:FMN phosphatase YigB (HAD superfamily)
VAAELAAPRAILVDVGDTLLEERRFDLAAGIRAVVGDRDRSDALATTFRTEAAAQHLRHRELLLAGWLHDRVETLRDRSVADIEDIVWRAVVTLAPRPGVHQALMRVVADGVPLAAISNAAFSGRVLTSELARHELAAPLRFVLSSADLNIRKPAVGIFAAAIERLAVPANVTWFVGDTWTEDILGAREAGLQPLWFGGSSAEAGSVPVIGDWAEFGTRYVAARNRARTG